MKNLNSLSLKDKNICLLSFDEIPFLSNYNVGDPGSISFFLGNDLSKHNNINMINLNKSYLKQVYENNMFNHYRVNPNYSIFITDDIFFFLKQNIYDYIIFINSHSFHNIKKEISFFIRRHKISVKKIIYENNFKFLEKNYNLIPKKLDHNKFLEYANNLNSNYDFIFVNGYLKMKYLSKHIKKKKLVVKLRPVNSNLNQNIKRENIIYYLDKLQEWQKKNSEEINYVKNNISIPLYLDKPEARYAYSELNEIFQSVAFFLDYYKDTLERKFSLSSRAAHAMSCGALVITSKHTELGYLLNKQGSNLCINSDDLDDFIKKFEELDIEREKKIQLSVLKKFL